MYVYDLLSQIINLKLAVRKRIFFCFNAPSRNANELIRLIFKGEVRKFSVRDLLCNIHLFTQLKLSSGSRNNIEYIVALPLQQWLHKLAYILRCTHIA